MERAAGAVSMAGPVGEEGRAAEESGEETSHALHISKLAGVGIELRQRV